MGRLGGALLIDWLLCVFIATALLRSQYWALALFAAEVYILTVLTGTTIGKRTVRHPGWPGWTVGRWALGGGLVRTVLLLCVVPPLIMDRDQRGLHDKAANRTVLRVAGPAGGRAAPADGVRRDLGGMPRAPCGRSRGRRGAALSGLAAPASRLPSAARPRALRGLRRLAGALDPALRPATSVPLRSGAESCHEPQLAERISPGPPLNW